MVASVTKYLLKNPMGNWNAGTWNVLPSVLTAWANLIGTQGRESEYALYREQAKNYKETARMNADLIKSQGEIALRNLVYKDKLERGADVARLGATGGNLSGTNLDVLVQKEKVRKMDEQTLRANYAQQAMLEMYNGYNQAANVYGTLSAKAESDKYGIWASVFKGLETYVGLSMRDAKVENGIKEGYVKAEYQKDFIETMYKDEVPKSLKINADENKVENNKTYGIIGDFDYLPTQGIA